MDNSLFQNKWENGQRNRSLSSNVSNLRKKKKKKKLSWMMFVFFIKDIVPCSMWIDENKSVHNKMFLVRLYILRIQSHMPKN